jgi:hypothetical protein
MKLRCVSPAFEFALRQSPKMALGPTLEGLKRAAEARKSQRIAERLATLAAGAQRAMVTIDPSRQVPRRAVRASLTQ